MSIQLSRVANKTCVIVQHEYNSTGLYPARRCAEAIWSLQKLDMLYLIITFSTHLVITVSSTEIFNFCVRVPCCMPFSPNICIRAF